MKKAEDNNIKKSKKFKIFIHTFTNFFKTLIKFELLKKLKNETMTSHHKSPPTG